MKFNIWKTIRKGIEGSVISGGAAQGVISATDLSADLDDVEHAVSVLVCAGAGFLYRSLVNWLKNRRK